MAQIVTTPDGSQHSFPDNATPEQIQEALKTYKPDSLTAPQSGTLAAGTNKGPELTNPIEDPQRLPPVLAQGVASLPTDPNAKVRYLAKSLFPKLSDSAALDRIGFKNGRVIYKADDGKVYYAEPSFEPLSHPGRTFMEAPSLAAGQVGPSMTTAGAIGGGVATPELLGGVPGSAGGAAVADMARQGLASWLTGETKPPLERAFQTGEEALLAGGGQLGGNVLFHGVNKLLNLRNPLRVSGYDVSQMTGPRIAAGEARTNLAQGMGVTVLPGEAMNSRSLLFRQRQLGREQEGATPLADFYLKRNTEQLPQAWERHVLDPISPVTAPALGARLLQTGADETITAARTERSAAAAPFYKQAYGENQSIDSPVINQILRTPAGRSALGDAVKLMQNDMSRVAVPDPEMTAALNEAIALGQLPETARTGVGVGKGLKLRTLDYIKQALWDQEQAVLGRHGEPTSMSRSIGNLRTSLTSELDNLDVTAMRDRQGNIVRPGLYAQARGKFGDASGNIDDMRDGLVGLAAADRARGFQNVPTTMFGSISADPLSITSARNAFDKAGKQDEWNAGVRSYLDNLFSTAAKQEQGPATNLWKTIQGDRRQLANLKAALAPDQFQALDDFMQVAEMVKRAPAEGSPTASDINKRSSFAGPLARGVATAINVPRWPQWLADKFLDYSSGKNIGQLVETLAQPNAIRALRMLKALPPGTQKWTAAATNLMTEIGGHQLGQEISGSPDQPLGYLLQSPPTP